MFSAEGLFILLLILLNGAFAMAEIAVVSARRIRLQQRAEEGDAGAKVALGLAEEPNRFLSTVQIGITVIGTLSGAMGGATLAAGLAETLRTIPALAPSAEAISLAVVVGGIAYLSLVLGELAPKRLALGNPEGIASAVARPMALLSRVTSPLVSLLSFSTDVVIRVLGVQPSEDPPVTEEEVRIMIETGRRAGIFEESEQNIVENLFRLGDRRVSALATPHTELVRLDIEDSDEVNWRKIADSPYQHFPVYRGSPDNILGLASVKLLWSQMINEEPPSLVDSLLQPLFVPESTPALKVLGMLRQAQVQAQAAFVLDERGSILGMVTLTDLLESLVGEIASEGAYEDPDIFQREDGSWLVDGLLPVDVFEEYFDVSVHPVEEQDYQTMGGFVMSKLGHIPETGDVFEWEGLRVEVVDMDELRVDKILVSRIAADEKPDQA